MLRLLLTGLAGQRKPVIIVLEYLLLFEMSLLNVYLSFTDWALGAVLYELEQLEYQNWLENCALSGASRLTFSGLVCAMVVVVTFCINNVISPL